jgi:putative cell wall-binding protein
VAVTATTAVFPPNAESALAGSDRYGTAIAISQDSFPSSGSAKTVVVTSGANFPDALSAAPAAVKLGGPLLLTLPDRLLPSVATEVRRLRPQRIVVVGGTSAVGAAVISSLARIAPTVRLAGADRYATSLAVAKFTFGSTNVPTAYFATGVAFPDALSASAYAGAAGVPVLLVPGNVSLLAPGDASILPSGLAAWMRSAHVTNLNIVGGLDAIRLPMQVAIMSVTSTSSNTFGGTDRFDTNRRIIDDNARPMYTGATTAYLASGVNFPDALAGAAAAGKAKEPLILVAPNCVPAATASMIGSMGIATVKPLGGPAAIGPGVRKMASC